MYNIDIQSPEFVKCLERGEREAFQRLFEMYHKALCFFATRIVLDSLEAEDIVQDVFLALWERREEVDFDRPLLPLLFVAVKNRAIDLLRSKKWRGGESGLDELDVCIRTLVADHIEEEFQLSQLSEEIDCCISGLSEQCRRVFLLSRTTGLKNREIAERLNISVKTVEKHIGAALSQLRLRLSRSGFLRLFL